MLYIQDDCLAAQHMEMWFKLWNFVPKRHIVNHQFYAGHLTHLQEDVQTQHPEKWCPGNWFLHHGNGPAHSAWTMQEFLANYGMTVVTHPSHSPDPTPYVIFFSQNGSWYSREGNFNTSA